MSFGEAAREDGFNSLPQSPHEGDGLRIAVCERQPGVQAVVRTIPKDEFAQSPEPEHTTIVEHDSLRCSNGP